MGRMAEMFEAQKDREPINFTKQDRRRDFRRSGGLVEK
jgi:hypothetical protein